MTRVRAFTGTRRNTACLIGAAIVATCTILLGSPRAITPEHGVFCIHAGSNRGVSSFASVALISPSCGRCADAGARWRGDPEYRFLHLSGSPARLLQSEHRFRGTPRRRGQRANGGRQRVGSGTRGTCKLCAGENPAEGEECRTECSAVRQGELNDHRPRVRRPTLAFFCIPDATAVRPRLLTNSPRRQPLSECWFPPSIACGRIGSLHGKTS